jgi:hypothetical protein
MTPSRTMIVVGKVYDNVEAALWAALVAFVVYFVACIAPYLPEAARGAERARVLQAADDNAAYCEKWGMKRGTREHALCAADLYELRKKIGQQFADEAGVF